MLYGILDNMVSFTRQSLFYYCDGYLDSISAFLYINKKINKIFYFILCYFNLQVQFRAVPTVT